MHGYELLGRISMIFEPYTPSPGTVYPAVAALEEEGLVRRRARNRRTVYEVTPQGRKALEARRETLHALERRLAVEIGAGEIGRLVDDLRERMRQLEPVVGREPLRRVLAHAEAALDRLEEPQRKSKRRSAGSA